MSGYIQYVELANILRPFISNLSIIRNILAAFEYVILYLIHQADLAIPVTRDEDITSYCKDTLVYLATMNIAPPGFDVQGALAGFDVVQLIQVVIQSAEDLQHVPGETNSPSRVMNWLIRSAMEGDLEGDVRLFMKGILIMNVWPLPEYLSMEVVEFLNRGINDGEQIEGSINDWEDGEHGEEVDGYYDEDDVWYGNQYYLAEDVQLAATGTIINVFEHATPIAQPVDDDSVCVLCQGTAEEEEQAKELHFWAHLRVCLHRFHATCLSELLNSVSAGQDSITCPLCKTVVCPRRMANPVLDGLGPF